jgi:hypothetical protein
MTSPKANRLSFLAVWAGLATILAGCQSGMTYGTGTTPGAQTLQDLTGIASLSNAPKEAIDYKPRPGLVAPPAVGELPPPTDGSAPVLAANWPVDPDVQRAALKADIAAREEAGLPTPAFSLPANADPVTTASIDPDKPMTAEEIAAVRKAFAEARGTVAVDESGNPVRRFLTDPPNEYRQPDPESAVTLAEMPKKKRKFLWWTWEQ